MTITYSEFVFVALGIQHAMRMRYSVVCGLPAVQYFFKFILQKVRFSKKKITEHKMCVLIFCTTFV